MCYHTKRLRNKKRFGPTSQGYISHSLHRWALLTFLFLSQIGGESVGKGTARGTGNKRE